MPVGGEDEEEVHAMLRLSLDHDQDGDDVGSDATSGLVSGTPRMRRRTFVEWSKEEVLTMTPGRWLDLRNLLLEVSDPSMLLGCGLIRRPRPPCCSTSSE
jgi:hypothetical protein